jgi:general secretion pathway protein C
MHDAAKESSRIVERVAAALATVAALALLGCVLAYWTWTWFAPRAESRSSEQVTAPPISSASSLFGGTQRAAAAPSGVAITLLGLVAASRGRPGHAVLRLDGTQTAIVREGDEIATGLRLVEVHVDHVVLDHRGVRQTLAWPAVVGAAPPAAKNTLRAGSP